MNYQFECHRRVTIVWGLCLTLGLVAVSAVGAESILSQPDKKTSWQADMRNRFSFMEKNPRYVWPEDELGQPAQEGELPKAAWKVQKPTGEIEYPEKSPDPSSYSNVWRKAGSRVQIQVNYVGMRTAEQTPKAR